MQLAMLDIEPVSHIGRRPAVRRVPGLLAVVLLVLLGTLGCAFGNRHDYRVHLPPPVEGRGNAAVAVHDQRPEVVDGAEDPDYVGMQRASLGNPFDVSTESGLPLVEDWAHVVRDAMNRGGFRTRVVGTSPRESQSEVVRRLCATGAPALILFVVHEWHAETYVDTTLHYDVGLRVLSPAGAVLAETRSSGESELGGDALAPASHAKKVVPAAFKRKLDWMLGEAEIVRALAAAAGTPHPSAVARHAPHQRSAISMR